MATGPEDEDYNHLMEGPTATGTITNTTELRAILSTGKMMTFRRGHYHVRDSGMPDDLETALEAAIKKLGDLLGLSGTGSQQEVGNLGDEEVAGC